MLKHRNPIQKELMPCRPMLLPMQLRLREKLASTKTCRDQLGGSRGTWPELEATSAAFFRSLLPHRVQRKVAEEPNRQGFLKP